MHYHAHSILGGCSSRSTTREWCTEDTRCVSNQGCEVLVLALSLYLSFQVMPFSTACHTPLSNFEASQNYSDVTDPASELLSVFLQPVSWQTGLLLCFCSYCQLPS